MRDPYELLGVSRNASETEIKAAFRKQAVQHHPDRNPGDPSASERFKEINEAYQILSDPNKRAAFDRYGEAAFDPMRGQPGAGGPGFGFVDFQGFEGIFGDILGAFGFRGGGADPGELRLHVRLSFEEAVLGCDKELTYECVDLCTRCNGSTAEPGSKVEVCGTCAGRGRVRMQQAFFPVAVERPCPRCNGLGRMPTVRCTQCSGRGVGTRRRTLQMTIPAGIEDGSTRTVENAGNRVRGDRPPGDLTLVVSVAPHQFFRRIGDDLACRLSVGFVQATLGAEVEVPTLEGPAKLRIPPGTQPGSVLRLRGHGVPHRARGGRGDQLVEVHISVPTELNERARELVRELAGELGDEVQPGERTFVDKIRSLFE